MQSGRADVPGASLNGRRPELLKVPKLKLWLAGRGVPTKRNKADLVQTQFYCTMDAEKNITFARDHQYYDQLQLQLYTSCGSWCDLCVYTTTKDIAIQRIYPNEHWQVDQVPKLDSFSYEHMLPKV